LQHANHHARCNRPQAIEQPRQDDDLADVRHRDAKRLPSSVGIKGFTVLRDRFERGEQRQGTLMKVHGELRGFHALWSTNKERVLVVLA
jgi:hypothetical protein